MLVVEDGETIGSVSGGCLERDVIRRSLAALAHQQPELVTYDTAEDDEVGAGCLGQISIFVEPADGSHLAILERWQAKRLQGVVATVVGGEAIGARLLLSEQGELAGDLVQPDVADGARAALAARSSILRRVGSSQVWFEVITPAPRLVLFGAGHDAEPLAAQAKLLGWHLTVIDVGGGNRTRARFASADSVLIAGPEEACARLSFAPDMNVVLMTHNRARDRRLLELLLPSPVGYLGMLGPRTRAEALLAELREAGHVFDTARLHAPIGFDIGAETPAEIAVAVVAEIRAFLAGRTGGPLRDRRQPIHAHEP
jgi:xanthine/CO dehydrogenase XdhC/CoxF family maturation factor